MIDLTVEGDPASCTKAGSSIAEAATALGTAATGMAGVQSSSSFWTGGAGDSFRGSVKSVVGNLDDLETRVNGVSRALDDFAGQLTKVKSHMDDARDVASAAGLSVSTNAISEPAQLPDTASGGAVQAYNKLATAYNDAYGIVSSARKTEAEAHSQLESAINHANSGNFIVDLLRKMGVLPPGDGNPVHDGSYVFGIASLGAGTATDWMIKGKYGMFQPRDAAGRWLSPKDMSPSERILAARSDDSWHAKADDAAIRGKWEVAGKWASRAGLVVTAGVSAYDQWEADANNPALDDPERVTRATTMAASTTAGAWAGAEGGATVGAMIGSVFPGPGTVIGGAVGGLVGGFVGSQAGQWVGQHALGAVTDATHWTEGAAKTVGHVASDVGHDLNPFNW